ncbi:hypothetical protein KIN20_008132 [Parelaphostrongylus tenuis]|uniref:CB1 cannabinoid receptor-interacting protein 1 n=1 Tax=Parelaphostrongylus tenuis TaxID=148309 RepID=A0AAD5MND3_PARTN|nr:hypothetical protein KIN20_008132 [Parelaphostrongylus tenuis]
MNTSTQNRDRLLNTPLGSFCHQSDPKLVEHLTRRRRSQWSAINKSYDGNKRILRTHISSSFTTPLHSIDSVTESMPSSGSFQLQISISRAENGGDVFYKVDGERFEGGSKTLKFAINTRYKITLSSKPPIQFDRMHLAGCDLHFHSNDPHSGQYLTEWNTAGIDVCKKGARNNITLTLQGPDGVLKRQLQSKFYQKDDSHVNWGQKLDFIQWTCFIDGTGSISVADEHIK